MNIELLPSPCFNIFEFMNLKKSAYTKNINFNDYEAELTKK